MLGMCPSPEGSWVWSWRIRRGDGALEGAGLMLNISLRTCVKSRLSNKMPFVMVWISRIPLSMNVSTPDGAQ